MPALDDLKPAVDAAIARLTANKEVQALLDAEKAARAAAEAELVRVEGELVALKDRRNAA